LARFPDVSHDVRVSEQSKDSGRAKGSNSETGVLANLPRTRPQRSSVRRAAARDAAQSSTTAGPTKAEPERTKTATTKPTKAKPAKTRSSKAKRTAGRTGLEEIVPRQGFESDGEIASGSVQPPGAAELVSSAAELAGELAKAGVTGGARLLKDLFARLPPG
jgi:hypothetical protein